MVSRRPPSPPQDSNSGQRCRLHQPGPLAPPLPRDGHTQARLLGERRLKTLMTPTAVGAGGVDAVSVVAGAAGTFIHVCGQRTLSLSLAGCAPTPAQPPLTNALPPDVLCVAHVTLAAVAGRGGQAAAVETQVGEVSADVDGLVQCGCACGWGRRRWGGCLTEGWAPGSGPRLWVQTHTQSPYGQALPL